MIKTLNKGIHIKCELVSDVYKTQIFIKNEVKIKKQSSCQIL